MRDHHHEFDKIGDMNFVSVHLRFSAADLELPPTGVDVLRDLADLLATLTFSNQAAYVYKVADEAAARGWHERDSEEEVTC